MLSAEVLHNSHVQLEQLQRVKPLNCKKFRCKISGQQRYSADNGALP